MTLLENIGSFFKQLYLKIYAFVAILFRPFNDFVLTPVEAFLHHFVANPIYNIVIRFRHVFAPFDIFKADSDKYTHVSKWAETATVAYVFLFIFVPHFCSAITFLGLAIGWTDTDMYTIALVVFTSLHGGFFLIYYLFTRIVSRWYSLNTDTILDNKRDIGKMDFGLFMVAVIFIVITATYGAHFHLYPELYNGTLALVSSRYSSLCAGIADVQALFVIYMNVGAYGRTQPILFNPGSQKAK